MNNNEIIVDKRNVGKTTFLYNEITKSYNKYNFIVLDSATDHVDKSLLRKLVSTYNDAVVIYTENPSQIILSNMKLEEYKKIYKNYFPFCEITANMNKVMCFDLSYFLEKAYEELENNNSIELYNYYRKKYNDLSQQIITCILLMNNEGLLNNIHVVMDEIELPIVDYNLSELQNNITFLASVHPENSFGTFYQNFSRARFKPYIKEG